MKLTEAQIDFMERVRDGRSLRLSNREEDKVRQFCRRKGLAKVVMNPRRWVIAPAGRAALQEGTQP